MRIVMLVLVLAFNASTKAQNVHLPVDSSSKKISYAEVVTCKGLTKDDLYVRAREWFAKTYNSAQQVIQMDDKAAGKIIGKATARGSYYIMLTAFNYTLNYTMIVSCKDGRYKYEITDFTVKDEYGITQAIDGCVEVKSCMTRKGYYREPFKTYFGQVDQLATRLSATLKTALISAASQTSAGDEF